jgi:hypothetical protein
MWLVARQVGGNVGGEAVLRMVVAGAAGLAVYVGALAALRAPELTAARERFVRHRTAVP